MKPWNTASLMLGVIIIVALICFTILTIFNASGQKETEHTLLGLVAAFTGGYAILRSRNGNGGR